MINLEIVPLLNVSRNKKTLSLFTTMESQDILIVYISRHTSCQKSVVVSLVPCWNLLGHLSLPIWIKTSFWLFLLFYFTYQILFPLIPLFPLPLPSTFPIHYPLLRGGKAFLGSKQSLTNQGTAGSSSSSLFQGWARYPMIGIFSKNPVHEPGIGPGSIIRSPWTEQPI